MEHDIVLTDAEVELLQCLLDRYGEAGKLVDLSDWPGFIRIVRSNIAALAKETP